MTGASIDLTRPLVELVRDHYEEDLPAAVPALRPRRMPGNPLPPMDENRPLIDLINEFGPQDAYQRTLLAYSDDALRGAEAILKNQTEYDGEMDIIVRITRTEDGVDYVHLHNEFFVEEAVREVFG